MATTKQAKELYLNNLKHISEFCEKRRFEAYANLLAQVCHDGDLSRKDTKELVRILSDLITN